MIEFVTRAPTALDLINRPVYNGPHYLITAETLSDIVLSAFTDKDSFMNQLILKRLDILIHQTRLNFR